MRFTFFLMVAALSLSAQTVYSRSIHETVVHRIGEGEKLEKSDQALEDVEVAATTESPEDIMSDVGWMFQKRSEQPTTESPEDIMSDVGWMFQKRSEQPTTESPEDIMSDVGWMFQKRANEPTTESPEDIMSDVGWMFQKRASRINHG